MLLQDLGLEIAPLRPLGFANVTTQGEASMGTVAFSLIFQTDFSIKRADDEAAYKDLLRIGLEYYLQEPSDDGVKDDENLVTL